MRPDYLALIAAGGPVIVAVTALLLNWWGFRLVGERLALVERRLEIIESDLKEFYRDMVLVKTKIGL